MSYWLLDNQNPNAPVRDDGNRFWGYPSRRQQVRLVVMHVPVAIQDLEGEDPTAEKVAAYFSRTKRKVSAHAAIDADSIVPLLPVEYTAFHVRGYNSMSVGVECGWDWDDWGKYQDRDEQVIRNAAEYLRPVVAAYGIPLKQLTKAQVDNGESGFAAHATLDPDRRKDPGPGFPWSLLFSLIGGVNVYYVNDVEGSPFKYDPDDIRSRFVVEHWQRKFIKLDPSLRQAFDPSAGAEAWGLWTPEFAQAMQRFGGSARGIGPAEEERINDKVFQKMEGPWDDIARRLDRIEQGLKEAAGE